MEKLQLGFGLRARFMVIVLALALLPLVLLPVILGRYAHRTLEEQAVALQQEVAARVAVRIEATLAERSNDLAYLDRVSGIRTLSRSEQRSLLSSLLAGESLFQDLAVVDVDGHQLVRVARDEANVAGSEDRLEAVLVRRAADSKATLYGDVWFDEDAREPLMSLARPLVDPSSGSVDSVVVAHVRFKPIWDVLGGLDVSDGRDVYIVNEAGRIVAHRNPSVVLRVATVDVPSSDGQAVGRTGDEVVSATSEVVLGTQTLAVVAEQPMSVALEPATKAITIAAIVATVALGLAALAVAFIARQFIRPIEQLASAARGVVGGHHEPLRFDRHDEIGDLARAFDFMVHELRELVESLEQRVQDRTFELEAAAAMQLSLIDELESKNSEMSQVQSQLERLVRSKDEFLGSVSHELRTPLASVVGFATELRDRYEDFDPEQRLELLGLIADQGQDMAHIINDLLVAARADSDSIVVKMAPVSLDSEIEAVLRQTPQVSVTQELPVDDVVVLADQGRVRQILRNLLTNAHRYGGPDVRVSVHEQADDVVITVSDDGTGIPESEWDTIFDPYTRSHIRAGQPSSVGLGLTVSRVLARRMGGELTYRYVDERSVFELVLARPPHNFRSSLSKSAPSAGNR